MKIHSLTFTQPFNNSPDGLLIKFLSVTGTTTHILFDRELYVIGTFNNRSHLGFTILNTSQIQVQSYTKLIKKYIF